MTEIANLSVKLVGVPDQGFVRTTGRPAPAGHVSVWTRERRRGYKEKMIPIQHIEAVLPQTAGNIAIITSGKHKGEKVKVTTFPENARKHRATVEFVDSSKKKSTKLWIHQLCRITK